MVAPRSKKFIRKQLLCYFKINTYHYLLFGIFKHKIDNEFVCTLPRCE